MYKIIAAVTVLLGIMLFVFHGNTNSIVTSDQVSGHIRQRIETNEIPSRNNREGSLPLKSPLLAEFYRKRDFRPAWSNGGALSHQIEPFMRIVKISGCEGLMPKDYHLDQIQPMINILHENMVGLDPLDSAKLADLDVMLTDAILLYASHLVNGRINHKITYPGWVLKRDSPDLIMILQNALDSGNIEESLTSLMPRFPGYARLKKELVTYQRIAANGGWPVVPEGPKIRKGAHDRRIATIRKRLMASGDLPLTADNESMIFDDTLQAAVRQFQKRHGLTEDDSINRPTLAALNIPVEKRIRQIALNMDRLRWFPIDIGGRYIIVNIADFSLQLIENGQAIMAMKIIAGKTNSKTNVLSREITYLELNPFWGIPDSIATKEMLPKIKKTPEYFVARKIRVFGGSKEIDPREMDWSPVKAHNLKYRFRQDPGPGNPLGRIKFMFPNEFDIYLHDTPNRNLFKRERRAFSHGCIRIEKPIDLAVYLLRNKESWTREKIEKEIRSGKHQVVMLPEPIHVHIFYGTAWVDPDGSLQFRDDLYRIDETPYEVSACGVHHDGQ
jgi:L,D-transpeptidase YcbB